MGCPRIILLIDQDMLIHLAVSEIYQDRGPYFITATSTADALQKMEIYNFDLFLLAFDLGDQDSLPLLQTINKKAPDIPVILMISENSDSCELIEAVEASRPQGLWQLIEKPFNLDVLAILIEKCMDEKARLLTQKLSTEQTLPEKRTHLRSSLVQSIQLTFETIDDDLSQKNSLKATLTDISNGGLGLVTKHPLKKAQTLNFKNLPVWTSGVVVWSSQIGNQICRAGIKVQ